MSTAIKAVHGHQTFATVTSLQNCVVNTIKVRLPQSDALRSKLTRGAQKETHRPSSYIFSGSRPFGLPIRHKLCTQTKVQEKAPSRRDESEPTRVRLGGRGTTERDKALMREAIAYADSLRGVKGEHGFLKEKNNLTLTPELGFCGKIYIPPKYSATDRATTIVEANTDQTHFIFFVDGSLITKTDPELGSVITSAGAAVVYKPLEPNQPWLERYFAPPKCEGGSDRIEVIAILDGLKTAAVETDIFRRCDSGDSDDPAAKLKATVFSDCTGALQQLFKLQSSTVAKSPLLDDPIVRELIAVSQYLQRKGVELELRWVPGHSLIPGNTFANGAAQYASRQPEIGAILEERLRVKVQASPRTAESHDTQKNYSPKTKTQEEKK